MWSCMEFLEFKFAANYILGDLRIAEMFLALRVLRQDSHHLVLQFTNALARFTPRTSD